MVLPPENMNDDFRALTGLERICRTCLSEKNFEDLRSLFDRSLGAQLSEITALKVEPNDGLPSNMCSDCYLTLNLAINFKDQCWKSENHLRSALSPSQTLYRSITILGSNTEDLRIQNFDDLDSSLLKHGTINHELLLPESIEITSNFGNGKHESEMIFIQTEIPEKKDNYINTSIPDSLEHIICSNKVEKAQIVPNTLVQSCDNGLDNSTKFENNQVIPGPGVQAGVLQKENIFIDPNIPVPLDLIECVSTEMPDTGNTIENGNCNIVAVSDKTENTQNEQHKDEQLPKVALQEPKHSSRIFFDCQYCEKYFKNAAALEIHLLKHGKKLKCEVCSEEFESMKIFRDHIIKHKDYRPFGCKVCGKSFSAPASLTKHMRIHEGKRKYLCTICGKRFYELTHLTIHTRTHTGEKPLICSICGKAFSDPHGLLIHNKIHTGEKNHECDICGRKFAHSFVLKSHMRTHTGEKPYQCSTCNACFATSSYLKIHKRIHSNERPYKCESCPRSFISKCGLMAHTQIHTGEKKYQCTECGKRTYRAADLQIHMRSHTGEKPYACDQCDKRYHTSSNLAAHKKTHLGLKEHFCTVCKKAFGDPRTLKSHIRTHTGEKPYVCMVCGRSYSQSGQLAAHRKMHVS